MPSFGYMDDESNDGTAPIPGAGSSAPGPIGDQPPAYRLKAVPQSDWDRFRSAANANPDYDFNQKNALSRIFAAEGGMKPNPQNGAVAGILHSTFGQLNADNQGRLNVNDPANVLQTYDAYFNKALHTVNRKLGVTGSEALNEIADPDSAAAFADTIFRHGSGAGTRLIQQSIQDTINSMSPEDCARLGIDPVAVDGKMGPQTFDAFKKISDSGYGSELRGHLADARNRAAPPRDSKGNIVNGDSPEKPRFDHFR